MNAITVSWHMQKCSISFFTLSVVSHLHFFYPTHSFEIYMDGTTDSFLYDIYTVCECELIFRGESYL